MIQDNTKFCKDCRWVDIPKDDEDVRAVGCNRIVSASITAYRVLGITEEPLRRSCWTERYDGAGIDDCGPEGKHWEARGEDGHAIIDAAVAGLRGQR